jgi:RNA polymerase sigma-70 factor, ECF subfamily
MHAPAKSVKKKTVVREFESYYRKYRHFLFLQLCNYTRFDEDIVDGITQDTFLKLYQTLCKGEIIDSPKAWLTYAGKNLCHDFAKKRYYTHIVATEQPDVLDAGPNPEQILLSKEKRQERLNALKSGWGKLTELERRCIILRAQGITLREISGPEGLDLRRIAETVQRAIKKLGTTGDNTKADYP